MRTLGLVVIAMTGLGLSGCSQVSGIFGKKKPHYHNEDGTVVYVDETLRTTPQQTYQFPDQSYDVDVYDGASQYGHTSQYSSATQYDSTSHYAGYGVELYNQQAAYVPPFADPRDTEFVMLNGKSEASDWRYCETVSRGYLYASEHDFRLDPDFEVCMRNKGYVMTTESGPTSKQILSAQTAGLRGVFQSQPSTSSYSGYSNYSGYSGY